MGLLIALEGLDQSGKKTQAELLAKKLKSLGYEVGNIAFPDYSTPIGRDLKEFLRGKRTFSPEVRQLLYAANRWERKGDIESWLREGKIVIADRYIPSGLAYGLSNNLDLEWMMALEEGLPRADVVMVIDIPVATAFQRSLKRDVYERDEDFLEKVRGAYLKLAKSFGWIVIDGKGSVDKVSDEIWKHVSKLLED